MYKAAIIGLGNIGFKLGLDPKINKTFSHYDMYSNHDDAVFTIGNLVQEKIANFINLFK